MDCTQAKALITRVVTGNADPAPLEVHAVACPACAEALRRARTVWTLMGRLPAVASTSAPPRMAPRRTLWFAAAAAVAAVVLAAVLLGRPAAPSAPSRVPDLVRTSPAPAAPAAEPEGAVVPEPSRQQVQAEMAIETVPPPERDVTPPSAPAAPSTVPEKAVVQAPTVEAPAAPQAPPTPAPTVARPEPGPAPATVPAAPDRSSRPTVATLRLAEGRVVALIDGARTEAGHGFRLTPGDGLETRGAESLAVLHFADGSRVSLGADTTLVKIQEDGGLRFSVHQGVIAAQVAKQPAEVPWIFETPQAEARILGTRLTLLVSEDATRLEVREGRVRLTRRDDAAAADVGPDQFAVAAKGPGPASKPIPGPKFALRETFDRGRWAPVWAAVSDPATGVHLAVQQGSLALLSSREATELPGGVLPNDTTPAQRKALEQTRAAAILGGQNKDWPRAASLATRGSFAVSNEAPLRLRARLWHPDATTDRVAWIGMDAGPAGGLALERRGRELRLFVEGAAKPLWSQEVAQDSDWELLELWMTRDRIAVRRNGLTLHAGAHPLQTKAVQAALGGRAKASIERDAESRFDDVDVAWVTKREFADVAR